jgi:hypothetical protein
MTVTPKSNWDSFYPNSHLHAGAAEAASVIFGVQKNKKKFKIGKGKIKDISKGLAEIAFSMGETNDPEEFAEIMAEDIFEAFKDVAERQKKKQKKQI